MFPLKRGDGDEISPDVFGGEEAVLLLDPGDGFVGVTVEPLNLVGAEQLLLTQQSQLFQALPSRVHLLSDIIVERVIVCVWVCQRMRGWKPGREGERKREKERERERKGGRRLSF